MSTLRNIETGGGTQPASIFMSETEDDDQDEDFRATSGSESEADDSASEGPPSPRSTPLGSQPQTPVLDHPEAEESSALFLEPLLTDAEIAKMVEEDDLFDGLGYVEESLGSMPFPPSLEPSASTGGALPLPTPVARRTRAQAPLHHMTIDELEELLEAEDEVPTIDPMGEAEYRRFIQSLGDPLGHLPLDEEEASGSEADEDFSPVAAAAPLYRALHALIARHVLLLMQQYLLAAAGGESARAARLADLLDGMRGCVVESARARRGHRVPPYDPAPMALEVDAPGTAQAAPTSRGSWAPRMPVPAHTIADVAALRRWPDLRRAVAPDRPQAAPDAPGERIRWEVDDLDSDSEEGEGAVAVGPTGPGGAAARKRAADAPSGWQPPKRRKRPLVHPQWSRLPEDVAAAWAPIQEECADPDLLPMPPDYMVTSQMIFSPAEDELLALGILRFGYDWERIVAELLPNKTPSQLFHRKKNQTTGSARPNSIKVVGRRGDRDAVATISGPLTPPEIALLAEAVAWVGDAKNRWELICKEYLPARQPKVLARLWSKHTGGASLIRPDKAARRRALAQKRRQALLREAFFTAHKPGGAASCDPGSRSPPSPSTGRGPRSVLLPIPVSSDSQDDAPPWEPPMSGPGWGRHLRPPSPPEAPLLRGYGLGLSPCAAHPPPPPGLDAGSLRQQLAAALAGVQGGYAALGVPPPPLPRPAALAALVENLRGLGYGRRSVQDVEARCAALLQRFLARVHALAEGGAEGGA
ncbi:Myb-like protein O [Auxenochlorella protothecoides]|uniref:Myb-like protein O n=1 Tax=Auxenochlorella protothecoides TaxID=3075 RepID=A0A087SMW5_AUXPR|nr:Myb-like protein O [Auxenochlorella protothecoides]KFM27069.1 Myb-like protein O [Auxenochlorella protothecoides]